MTVSHGVEGQLISEARICIYSDIKALKAHCRGADWVNKTIKKNGIWQPSVISLYTEIHEYDKELTAFILETKYDLRA